MTALLSKINETLKSIYKAEFHTKKLNCMANKIIKISNFLKKEENAKYCFNSSNEDYNSLVNMINEINEIAKCYDKKNNEAKILENKAQTLLRKFKDINKNIITLIPKLYDKELFTETSFEVEDRIDTLLILSRLITMYNKEESKSKCKTIEDKYNEYVTHFNGYDDDDDDKVSPEDITKEIMEIKDIQGIIIKNPSGFENKEDYLVTEFLRSNTNRKSVDDFKHKISICNRISYKCIAKTIGIVVNDGKYAIITEKFKGKTLYDELQNKKMSGTKKQITAFGIAKALLFLHKNGIMHRNLSPHCVYFDKKGHPKLNDFSLARDKVYTKYLEVCSGDPRWSAPEFINSLYYDESIDVYSFGMLLTALESGENPYKEYSNLKINNLLLTEKYNFNSEAEKLRILVNKCLELDTKARYTMEDVCKYIEENDIFEDVNRGEFNRYKDEINKIRIPKLKLSDIIYDKPSEHVIKTVSSAIDPDLYNYTTQFNFIAKITDDPNWKPFIGPLIAKLSDSLRECQDSNYSYQVIKLFSMMLDKNIDFNSFRRNNILNVTMQTLDSFITEFKQRFDIKYVFNIIQFSAKNEHFLTFPQMKNYSVFLESNNFDIKIKSTIILYGIISSEKEKYDYSHLYVSLIKNLSIDELVNLTMKTILKIYELHNNKKAFIEAEGIQRFIPVIISPNNYHFENNEKKTVFSTLEECFRENLSSHILYNIINQLNRANDKYKNNEKNVIENLARILIYTSKAFEKNIDNTIKQSYIACIIQYLNFSDIRVVLISLKILYRFAKEQNMGETVSKYSEKISEILLIDPEVAIMAGHCILSIIPYISYDSLESNFFNNIILFFSSKDEYSNANENLITFKLFFFNSLASNPSCAKFISKREIASFVIEIMNSDNESLRKQAYLCIYTFAENSRHYCASLSIENEIIDKINDEKLSPYPIKILSKLIVSPKVSEAIVKHLDKFIPILKRKNKEESRLILYTLNQAFSTPEVFELINNDKNITEILQMAEDFSKEEELWWEFVELVDNISETVVGLNAIKNSNILPSIVEYIGKKNVAGKNILHVHRIMARFNLTYD